MNRPQRHPRALSGPIRPQEVSVAEWRETEADFTTWVIDTAHLYGWKCAHFRPARVMRKGKETWETPFSADGKGFPDLVLTHPSKRRPLWFIELKSETGKVSPEQKDWLWLLSVSPSAQAAVWRPSDRDKITRTLKFESFGFEEA